MKGLFALIFLLLVLPTKWYSWRYPSQYNPIQQYTAAYWDGKNGVTLGTADSLSQWVDLKNSFTFSTSPGLRPVFKHPYVDFDGSVYTNGSDWDALDFGTSSFTISVRMYVSAYPAVLAIPIAKMDAAVSVGWRFYINSAGQLYLQLVANGNQLTYRLNSGDIDGLHNYTFTVDRANNVISCWRDRVKIPMVAVSTTLLSSDNISNTAGFHVGRYDYTGGYFFIGRIYALRVDSGIVSVPDIVNLHKYWDSHL